jgi:hypothetical protein
MLGALGRGLYYLSAYFFACLPLLPCCEGARRRGRMRMEEGTYADSNDTGPATASPPSSKYLKHPSLRIAKSAISSAGHHL